MDDAVNRNYRCKVLIKLPDIFELVETDGTKSWYDQYWIAMGKGGWLFTADEATNLLNEKGVLKAGDHWSAIGSPTTKDWI